MRGLVKSAATAVAAIAVVGACAHRSAVPAEEERLQGYIFERNIDDVWPLARAMLLAHHFTVQPASGTYRMETAPRPAEDRARQSYPDGGLAPEVNGYQEKSGEWTAAPPGYGKAGMERGGNGMGAGGHPGAPAGGGTPHVVTAPSRVVVEGEALDDTHCRVSAYRIVSGADATPQFAPDLERELIARAQPADAGAIQGELR